MLLIIIIHKSKMHCNSAENLSGKENNWLSHIFVAKSR